MMTTIVLMLVLAFTVAGGGENPAVNAPDLTGKWYRIGKAGYTITLRQSGTNLVGEGVLTIGGEKKYPLTISGTCSGTNVFLSFFCQTTQYNQTNHYVLTHAWFDEQMPELVMWGI